MTKFAEMGKVELRAACKAAGISYGKLNNDGMRAALEAHDNAFGRTFQEGVAYDSNQIADLDCPACGIGLDNGVLNQCDEAYSDGGRSTGRTLYQEGMTKEWECMGCGAQFGTECEPYVKPASSAPTGKGLKIEANREERNGIKRPSVGGKCRAIWDWLDAHPATPTAKNVRAQAEEAGWNPNNAVIEFYQWRKFNGVTGRAK